MSQPDPAAEPPTAAEPAKSRGSNRWGDLLPRLVSALVMIVLGGGAIFIGGWVFAMLVVLAAGAMIWELSRITQTTPAQGGGLAGLGLALLAVAMLLLNITAITPWPAAFLLLPSIIGLLVPRRDPWAWGLYAMVIMAASLALVILRVSLGMPAVLIILTTVIASDVAGYFAGRILGGPKFWPRFSPKKTWSGTVAGWIAAGLIGLVCYAYGWGGFELIFVLPVLAFAGQLGDIAESAIKRRAGVKDASQLIPGHGGLLDRFDALAFAAILALVWQIFVPVLPVPKFF